MIKNPRILLINPPFERLKGFSIESMSLGLLSLASVLVENGYKANVYDADTTFKEANLRDDISGRPKAQQNYVEALDDMDHVAWRELRKVVLDYKPDIVGITIKTPTYHSTVKTASIVRELFPEAVIVVGGPHLTITGDDMLKHSAFDYSFTGEAEYTLLEFVQKISSGKDVTDIRGLNYRSSDGVVKNQRPERIDTLDDLPFPDKDLLIFKEKYKYKLGAILTSRGCPYDCTFCATIPLWGRTVRYRSPQSIVGEISWLYEKYGIKTFEILDDTFTLRKAEVIKVCKGLVEKYGEKFFKWVCITNINVLDEELVQHLKSAGCYKINIGVESGSNRILKLIKKNTTTEMITEAVRIIKKNGLLVHGYFMMGLPEETEEDMLMTIDFIKRLRPDSINLCTFTPYPNTGLYDMVLRHQFVDPDDDYEMYKTTSTHSDKNFFMKDVDKEVYQKHLKTVLELVGEINAKKNWRKIKHRYNRLTPTKIKNKILSKTSDLLSKN